MTDENRVDIEKSKGLLKKKVNSRMSEPGDYETGLPGVRIYRRDEADKKEPHLYRPMIIKVVQGFKRLRMGVDEYRYGESEVLVTGVDMPAASLGCEASPDLPCTSISIDLDKNLIIQLALDMPDQPAVSGKNEKGAHFQTVNEELLDAYVRLAELLDQPAKLLVLGPMIVREIHYLLLAGPDGHRLRSFHTLGSQNNQVAQAILWLKQNLATAFQIEELAERVNMAPSTFHRHFKEVTTLSPVQFQKRLRLHEAQRLMLMKDLDAGSASAAVGYDSLSQFNREYKRLFGDPPRKDVKRLRDEAMYADLAPAPEAAGIHGF